jgi:hypothetical protein
VPLSAFRAEWVSFVPGLWQFRNQASGDCMCMVHIRCQQLDVNAAPAPLGPHANSREGQSLEWPFSPLQGSVM